MNVGLFFDLNAWFFSVILGYARLIPSFFVLPFLNSNVLSGVKRNAVIMIVAMGYMNVPLDSMVKVETAYYLPMLLQEFLIGIIIAILLSWPFWIFHAVGNIIDNQRGSTLSSTIDPANGVDTSELANLFNFLTAAIYLSSGGLLLFVEAIEYSYKICVPLEGCSFNRTILFPTINEIVGKTIIIASPVLAAMLISEFILGLLSRFSPQLNAFSISLSVKTLIALAVLFVYLSPFFPEEVIRLSLKPGELSQWLFSK